MSNNLPPHSALTVLRYFLQHPDAADSLDGIVRWRLMEHGVLVSMRDAGLGVDWLVERDYLVRLETASAGAVFRLNAAARDQAVKLLT